MGVSCPLFLPPNPWGLLEEAAGCCQERAAGPLPWHLSPRGRPPRCLPARGSPGSPQARPPPAAREGAEDRARRDPGGLEVQPRGGGGGRGASPLPSTAAHGVGRVGRPERAEARPRRGGPIRPRVGWAAQGPRRCAQPLPPVGTRPPFGGGAERPGPAQLGGGLVPAEGAARPAPAQRQQPERRHHLGGAGPGSPLALRVSLAAFSCLHPPRSSAPPPLAIFTREELGGTSLKLCGGTRPAPPGRPQTIAPSSLTPRLRREVFDERPSADPAAQPAAAAGGCCRRRRRLPPPDRAESGAGAAAAGLLGGVQPRPRPGNGLLHRRPEGKNPPPPPPSPLLPPPLPGPAARLLVALNFSLPALPAARLRG